MNIINSIQGLFKKTKKVEAGHIHAPPSTNYLSALDFVDDCLERGFWDKVIIATDEVNDIYLVSDNSICTIFAAKSTMITEAELSAYSGRHGTYHTTALLLETVAKGLSIEKIIENPSILFEKTKTPIVFKELVFA